MGIFREYHNLICSPVSRKVTGFSKGGWGLGLADRALVGGGDSRFPAVRYESALLTAAVRRVYPRLSAVSLSWSC